MTDARFIFDQEKPPNYQDFLFSWYGHSFGDQDTISPSNLVNDPQFLTWSQTRSIILGAQNLIDWKPELVVSTFSC